MGQVRRYRSPACYQIDGMRTHRNARWSVSTEPELTANYRPKPCEKRTEQPSGSCTRNCRAPVSRESTRCQTSSGSRNIGQVAVRSAAKIGATSSTSRCNAAPKQVACRTSRFGRCRERSALQPMAMQHLDGAEAHEIQLVQDTADGPPLWDQNREGTARVPQST